MHNMTKQAVEAVPPETRAARIENGKLIDVSAAASKLGYINPVAVTRSVWNHVIVPSEAERRWGQTEESRLHDMLFQYRLMARRHPASRIVTFRVPVSDQQPPHNILLTALSGPGDDCEPVITIMPTTEVF